MKFLLIVIMILGIGYPLSAQEISRPGDLELSTGFSMLVYQSVFSFQGNTSFETVVRGHITGMLDWQAGARLGFKPALPEGFARILVAQKIGVWSPSVGIEFGVTNRAHFTEGSKLLRETRQAMEGDISHIYIAGHASPLSFKIRNRWRFDILDVQFGTHPGHIGRTARLQVGFISVGRTW